MAFLMLSVTEDQWSMEGTELGTGQSLRRMSAICPRSSLEPAFVGVNSPG